MIEKDNEGSGSTMQGFQRYPCKILVAGKVASLMRRKAMLGNKHRDCDLRLSRLSPSGNRQLLIITIFPRLLAALQTSRQVIHHADN